jgi:aminoglycoside 2'-N-acetyltransferase I
VIVRVLTTLDPALADAVRGLVDAAFGGEFSDEDWAHALGGHHVVVLDGDSPVAHAAVVPRTVYVAGTAFATGYVEAVATLPDRQGTGLGSEAMTRATALVRERYDLGGLSTGRPAFYERLGWERWRGPSFVRDGERLVRTADDDDGILVLRHGPSAALDLAADVACEARPGDDW